LARTGGDDFCALLVNLRDLKEAEDTACKVLKEFERPFNLAGHELVVTPSIGVAMFPRDGETAEVLLRHAERAMYQAKDHGRNAYEVYADGTRPDALEYLKLSGHLRRALDREEFLVYFQPKVDIEARRVIGAEALVRWSHPELGIVSPDKFIPLAEEQGLIVELGAWVLRAACRQIQQWRQQGLPQMQLSVNVSAVQLAQGKILHAVRSALEETALPPDHLVLELTESVLLRDVGSSMAALRELKGMGVRLSVDDFGTGYSSLGYLMRFPLHEIKIDRSFVKSLPVDKDSSAIVGAIIALARELGLRVVAEGVETGDQLRFLMQRRCNEFQGYLCSRPLPPEEFREFLRNAAAKAA
jgi:EAL domain-containing protein (putative c-di-GMP-specific phosphodiesterase class I)